MQNETSLWNTIIKNTILVLFKRGIVCVETRSTWFSVHVLDMKHKHINIASLENILSDNYLKIRLIWACLAICIEGWNLQKDYM